MQGEAPCKICAAPTQPAGIKFGKFARRAFHLRHCSTCHFSFVADATVDFDKIYSSEYYRGKGADPYVDYLFELEHPAETIRRFEWQGITRVVSALRRIDKNTRWLDYGCGNGGLVRYCREHLGCQMEGFDQGWIRQAAAERGVSLLTEEELAGAAGSFDVVTAVEVLEHIPEPLPFLKHIQSLLRPGGLFFYTTGNAQPFRGRLADWRYVVPEIHVSFFEPETLTLALQRTGFQTAPARSLPGQTDILRFKILKNLGVRRRRWIQQLLPWKLLTWAADRHYRILAHPLAWAPAPSAFTQKAA